MSSTTTPSDEDKLYMTDDLEGKLDPASLEEPRQNASKEDFYATVNSIAVPRFEMPELPPLPEVTVAVTFGANEPFVLVGSLSALSFGREGWLCTFGVEDSKQVFPIVVKASQEPIDSVLLRLPDGRVLLQTNIDCAVSFSYGSASFTVTSDEARYV